MNVSSLLVPSVSIVASANEVCKNADVIFTASAVNGGDHPVYQWEKNQVAVGAGNDTYTDHTLTDGDIIICKLMSNERCITEHTVSGNPVRISVYDDPVVTLDKNSNLCEGGSRVLDAGIFHHTSGLRALRREYYRNRYRSIFSDCYRSAWV